MASQTTPLHDIKSPYSTASVVSHQLRFHGEALTDVSHYKAWRGCSVVKRRSAEGRLTPSQLLSRQHAANLSKGSSFYLPRGNMSVTVSGSQLSELICLHLRLSDHFCNSLCCIVGLAHWQRGYSPAGNRKPATLNRARRNQPIQIHKIPLQTNPSGSVQESGQITAPAATEPCTYSSLHVVLLSCICELHRVI